MTRIDMTTREWHELVKPVLPHASTDKEFPELGHVRLEVGDTAIYAAATDRYTLGAERWPLPGDEHGLHTFQAVHLLASEVAASLKLFPHSKDLDPLLRITIDTTAIPIQMVGMPGSVRHLAVAVEPVTEGTGTRLVMHDHRDPSRDPLASWRKQIHAAVTRRQGRTLEGIDLLGPQLTRWEKAARTGERLTLFSGPKPGDPLLITVEKHFAGVAAVQQYLEGPARTLRSLPWARELGLLRLDDDTDDDAGSET